MYSPFATKADYAHYLIAIDWNMSIKEKTKSLLPLHQRPQCIKRKEKDINKGD